MIDVKVDKKADAYVLTVKGHSEADTKGKDIICASASILAYTLAQTVKFMHSQDKLQAEPKITLKEGYAKVSAVPKEEFKAEILYAFYFAQVGYSLLHHNYAKYVQVTTLKI